MRLETQGVGGVMDYSTAKVETAKTNTTEKYTDKEQKEKLGLEDIKTKQSANEDELIKATEIINEAMKISDHSLEFRLHDESGRYQVRVIDNSTDEVIREIPAEYILDISADIMKILDKMVGLLLDEKI